MFLFIVGCGALTQFNRSDKDAVISIVEAQEGGIVTRPADLSVLVGDRVLFVNHTDYTINLNLEWGDGKKEPAGTISPFSTRRLAISTLGEVRYTLFFSSSRNFGKYSGTVTVVGDSPEQGKPTVPKSHPPPFLFPFERMLI